MDTYVPAMLDMCLRRVQTNLATKGARVYTYGWVEMVVFGMCWR